MRDHMKTKKKGERGAIRAFFSYYKPHRKLFALDLVCSFTIAVCNLFYPFIARMIMNDFVPNRAVALIVIWAAALLAIYVLKAFLTYIVGIKIKRRAKMPSSPISALPSKRVRPSRS